MKTRLKKANAGFLRWIGRHPDIFRLYMGLRGGRPRRLLVRRDSSLVIEGFPRSANTFAVLAFEQAQGWRLRGGHHHHSPAQVLLAVRWNIPALVLLREPEAAIASLLIRDPDVTPRQALLDYRSFHQSLLPVRESLVVGHFQSVVSAFAKVIDAVNQRYRTDFRSFSGSAEETEAVFSEADELERTGDEIDESKVARPSEKRCEAKQEALDRLRSPEFADLLGECQRLYQEFVRNAV